MLSDIKQPTVVRKKRDDFRGARLIARDVQCPECGVDMVLREGQMGQFHGCQRFPLCLGTRPIGAHNKAKSYDSLTQLLLDTHALAVKHLAKPHMLGRMGCISWWLSRKVNLTDVSKLEEHVDAASAKATELGEPMDFIATVYEVRKRKKSAYINNVKKRVMPIGQLKRLPRPVFTKRWDTSEIDQIEIALLPDEEISIKGFF